MAKLSVQEFQGFITQRCPRPSTHRIRKTAFSGGIAGAIIFGLIFALFSTPFIILFFPWRIHHEWQLRRGPRETAIGVVTEAPNSNMTVNEKPVYKARFKFAIGESEYEGQSYSIDYRYNTGQSVEIEYLATNPGISRITGSTLNHTGFFGLIVLLFPLVGIGVMSFGYFSYRNRLRILQNGVFAAGQVTDISPTNTRVNNQTVYKIEIAFKTDRGTEQHSSYKTYAAGDIALAREKQQSGETAGLLYLPQNPEKILLVETLIQRS
jgi:hypothetical protein